MADEPAPTGDERAPAVHLRGNMYSRRLHAAVGQPFHHARQRRFGLLALPTANIKHSRQVLSASLCQASKPIMLKQRASQGFVILHGNGR
jgi:hypothetical protein